MLIPKQWLSRIRQFSPGLPHYVFMGVFVIRLLCLERLSRSALLLPARGDMHFYNEWAQRILRGDWNVHGAFYGLPLYPYVLAGLYRLFGSSPFIPGLLQAAADAGTALLIYLLTSHLLRSAVTVSRHSSNSDANRSEQAIRVISALAAAGWAFFVPAEAYAVILMPTACFIFVFWLVVWRLVSNNESPRWVECLWLGLLVGITAMAIATVLFLVPLVLTAVLFKRSSVARLRCLAAVVFLSAVGVGTSPCWIHNYFIARDPAFLSAHGGVNFWIGNNPIANGYPKFPPGLRAGQAAMLEDSVTSAEAAVGKPLKRSEVSAYWAGRAREYISAHPREWIRLMLTKVRNFWNAFQYDDLSIVTNLREQGIILPGLYFGLVAALGLPGLTLSWRAVSPSRWITAAIGLHMASLLPVFVTERYRMAIVPGLLILAAYGAWLLWNDLMTTQYRRASVYIAILVCSAAFVSWPQRDPALWALDTYNSGWQALESGDLSLADRKLAIARAYVPTNPETNFACGNLRLAQGDKPGAASFYLATLRYDENHRGALNNLAVIALEKDRSDLAEGWLRRAEQIAPGNAKTHFLLSKTLLERGDRNGAQIEAARAAALDPNQAEFAQLNAALSGPPN
jgi:Flp pilus assembly protein TadD